MKKTKSSSAEHEQYLQVLEDIKRIETLRLSNAVERTERKILLSTISNKLEGLYGYIRNNKQLCLEIPKLSRALTLRLNSELKWLQKEAEFYFQDHFASDNKKISNIAFLPKVDGVQLGNRMQIGYRDSDDVERHIIYFIKTHQYGSLRAGGSTVVPVDPKELFFYKVLEHTGFGPKAHFFFNPMSPTAFFIATQDEGFTKIIGKEKFFKTYGQSQEELDYLCHNSELGGQDRLGMALADLLLRIFNLWDITLNPGNYGYVSVNNERKKWRVIDFRVEAYADYYLTNVFEDYIDGKAMDGYIGLPRYVLNDISPEERVQLASCLMDEFESGYSCQSQEGRKMPVLDAIARAYEYVDTYITANNEILQLDLKTVMPDFQSYVEAVQINFKMFVDKLKEQQSSSLDISAKDENETRSQFAL